MTDGASTVFALTVNGVFALSGAMAMPTMLKLWIITKRFSMEHLPNIHPGEILREEFLVPLGITAYRLAKDIHVSGTRIADILAERRGISAETALRLSRYFGNSAQFWLNLQAHYELREAQRQHGDAVEAIRRYENLTAA